MTAPINFYSGERVGADGKGLRRFAGGTHTSRTIMLKELDNLLNIRPQPNDRDGYAEAIVRQNCLGKSTEATRRLSNTRLGEMYVLNPFVPLFRILRNLWKIDEDGRPLLAVLAALARDPLLLATAPVVLGLREREELSRSAMRAAISDAVSERLSAAVLEKVLRNAASSWTQSGHLEGRTFKHRRFVHATPASMSMALWIACQAGFTDTQAFESAWVRVLDCEPKSAMELAQEARGQGLIDLSVAERVVTLDFGRLDGSSRRR